LLGNEKETQKAAEEVAGQITEKGKQETLLRGNG